MSLYYPSKRSFKKKHELPLSNRNYTIGKTIKTKKTQINHHTLQILNQNI